MNTINYRLLARAQELYEQVGYKTIEVPWRVTTAMIEITKPRALRTDYLIQGTAKALIASGEQGFMYLMNKGFLPPGKYQTITPCFRNEPYDETHSKQFMKLELIEVVDPEREQDLHHLSSEMLGHVGRVFTNLAPEFEPFLKMVRQNVSDPLLVTEQYDLEVHFNDKTIELGSYGARRAHFGTWVYGTGLAEPRFSKTVQAVRAAS